MLLLGIILLLLAAALVVGVIGAGTSQEVVFTSTIGDLTTRPIWIFAAGALTVILIVLGLGLIRRGTRRRVARRRELKRLRRAEEQSATQTTGEPHAGEPPAGELPAGDARSAEPAAAESYTAEPRTAEPRTVADDQPDRHLVRDDRPATTSAEPVQGTSRVDSTAHRDS